MGTALSIDLRVKKDKKLYGCSKGFGPLLIIAQSAGLLLKHLEKKSSKHTTKSNQRRLKMGFETSLVWETNAMRSRCQEVQRPKAHRAIKLTELSRN